MQLQCLHMAEWPAVEVYSMSGYTLTHACDGHMSTMSRCRMVIVQTQVEECCAAAILVTRCCKACSKCADQQATRMRKLQAPGSWWASASFPEATANA
jgi:hypothetical protein